MGHAVAHAGSRQWLHWIFRYTGFEGSAFVLYRFTTVRVLAEGHRCSSKTEPSSKGLSGAGILLASLHAFSQLRHPTHAVKSVSMPKLFGQPSNSGAARARTGAASAAPPASIDIERNLRLESGGSDDPSAPLPASCSGSSVGRPFLLSDMDRSS